MSSDPLNPVAYRWDFWDSDDLNFPKHPEFFMIPVKRSDKFSSIGWWDGEEIAWMVERYHTGEDISYYIFKDEQMDDVSKSEWFDYVKKDTPQCLGWILFRLEDLNLL
jgi:hypothetical protein